METQPKFQFGDWLQEEGSSPFCVRIIHWSGLGYFYSDEAHKPFHQESRLKLIEQPKKKVVRRLYMMAYQSDIGWMVGHEMVDINFRDIDGVERFSRTPRKILKNSPFIDVEVDE
jgi:hypothetical protein